MFAVYAIKIGQRPQMRLFAVSSLVNHWSTMGEEEERLSRPERIAKRVKFPPQHAAVQLITAQESHMTNM